MAGYWPSCFFFPFVCTETKSRSIKTQKERGQYPAILTEQAWSVKDLLYGQKITPKNKAGAKRVIRSGQDRPILPARVAN